MAKKNDGALKTKKMYKAARTLAFTGMGISVLCLVGTLASLGVSIKTNNKKDAYLDAVSQTAVYQEYYEGEKTTLDDALYGKEITIDEYNERLGELKESGVEGYIEAQGTAEQQAELDKFNKTNKSTATASRVLRDISWGGTALALSSLVTTAVAASKDRKRFNAELQETEDNIKRIISKYEDPFPDFEEDAEELPNIEEGDERE